MVKNKEIMFHRSNPYVCLRVGFQPEEAADLEVLGVDDAGAHEVLRVGVDGLEQGEAVAQQLRLGLRDVHGEGGLEDLLALLAGPAI